LDHQILDCIITTLFDFQFWVYAFVIKIINIIYYFFFAGLRPAGHGYHKIILYDNPVGGRGGNPTGYFRWSCLRCRPQAGKKNFFGGVHFIGSSEISDLYFSKIHTEYFVGSSEISDLYFSKIHTEYFCRDSQRFQDLYF
jgi:hypothetical protein